MVQITIDDNLAQAIAQAGGLVTLIDSRGNTIAQAAPTNASGPVGLTPEHLAELDRRMKEDDGTRYTWAQVKEHLKSLAAE